MSLGRRERKKLETKERLLDCAVGLFAERGYDTTTMEDIGECADVARATVFNYFARKEDIVAEVFTRRRAEIAKLIASAEESVSGTTERLRFVLLGWARMYETDPPTGRAVVRAWLRAGGPLLGIDGSATYQTTEVDFAPGSVLLLYTDGLIESPGADIEDALADLSEVLAETGDLPLDELADHLVESCAMPRGRLDDVAVLLLRADT